eukprot:661351_1
MADQQSEHITLHTDVLTTTSEPDKTDNHNAPTSPSISSQPSKKNAQGCWYFNDAKCCLTCCTSMGPVTVQKLHKMWLDNDISDNTKVFAKGITTHYVEIHKIWIKNNGTVNIKQDAFNSGDKVRFKSWLSSPECYGSWQYVTKHQTGTVVDVSGEYIKVDFEADTGFGCVPHELVNITLKRKKLHDAQKCSAYVKAQRTVLSDLHSKFKVKSCLSIERNQSCTWSSFLDMVHRNG